MQYLAFLFGEGRAGDMFCLLKWVVLTSGTLSYLAKHVIYDIKEKLHNIDMFSMIFGKWGYMPLTYF